VECDPTRVCELLVALGDVEVLGIEDEAGRPLRPQIRRRAPMPDCDGCGRDPVTVSRSVKFRQPRIQQNPWSSNRLKVRFSLRPACGLLATGSDRCGIA